VIAANVEVDLLGEAEFFLQGEFACRLAIEEQAHAEGRIVHGSDVMPGFEAQHRRG